MKVHRLLVMLAVAAFLLPAVFYLDARGLLFVGEENRVYGGEASLEGGEAYSTFFLFLLHKGDAVSPYIYVSGCNFTRVRYNYTVADLSGGLTYRCSGSGDGSSVALPLFVSGGDGLYLVNLSFVVDSRGECEVRYILRAVRGAKRDYASEYYLAALAGLAALTAVGVYEAYRLREGSQSI